MRGCKDVERSAKIGNCLKVERDIVGLQAGNLFLVFVVDVGQDRIFTLEIACQLHNYGKGRST